MLRRITLLIPLLAILTLSGCIVFPHGGWHHITTTTMADRVITSIVNGGSTC
ncbi:hypothetical protein [Pseudomonas laurylsulfativorans]|uniref:hypothetical protein n=1 Tax=Pseudomonas laurylsulfativorans TaxID=1943631 RepID=UPI0013FD6010|nr:hypothetical protein [Pseudomonas laurylsulfativorans]